MPQRSAGIALYRLENGEPALLLVHPGGPFWRNKDEGAWSIPKGLYDEGEDALEAAKREFQEETGAEPHGPFEALGEFKLPGGKLLSVWLARGEFDPATLRSNSFTMIWPPHSGQTATFPEVDRAGWFSLTDALRMLTKGQRQVAECLLARLKGKTL
jgi:predicted NUDIX family NTP pyrophosphohydrolase